MHCIINVSFNSIEAELPSVQQQLSSVQNKALSLVSSRVLQSSILSLLLCGIYYLGLFKDRRHGRGPSKIESRRKLHIP